MREYGQVQASFWTSNDIQKLSDAGKLLALYLLTGPHSNGIGCYRLPDGYVMADFEWDSERVSKVFAELFAIGFIERCETSFFILIPRFLKWNPISNGNVAKARMKEFESISKLSSVYSHLCTSILKHGNHLPNHYETLLKRYAKQYPTLPHPTLPESKGIEPLCDSPQTKLILSGGGMFLVSDENVVEFQDLYPDVDIKQELKIMQGWCKSNISKRKTSTGINKFINSWLAKEQKRLSDKINLMVRPTTKLQRAMSAIENESSTSNSKELNSDAGKKSRLLTGG